MTILSIEVQQLFDRLNFHKKRVEDYEKMQRDNLSRIEYHSRMMELVNAEILEKTGGR